MINLIDLVEELVSPFEEGCADVRLYTKGDGILVVFRVVNKGERYTLNHLFSHETLNSSKVGGILIKPLLEEMQAAIEKHNDN